MSENRLATETWQEQWVIYQYYTEDAESERWCIGPFPTSEAADVYVRCCADIGDNVTSDVVPFMPPDMERFRSPF